MVESLFKDENMSGDLSSVTLKYTNRAYFQTFREAQVFARTLKQGCSVTEQANELGMFVVYWSSDE